MTWPSPKPYRLLGGNGVKEPREAWVDPTAARSASIRLSRSPGARRDLAAAPTFNLMYRAATTEAAHNFDKAKIVQTKEAENLTDPFV